MGIKRIICSICKTEVNKAQTYHVGNGERACKSHEGVTEKKETLQKNEAQKLQRSMQQEQHRQQEHPNKDRMEDFTPGMIRCAVCRNEGMRSDQFFTRVLIERSKAEQIYGVFNPFDPKHPGNQVKIAERCVFVLEKSKLQPIINRIRGDFKQILDLVGAVGVCGPCCKAGGIDPLPKVEFDELTRFAAVSEIVVKPVVDAIAKQEMSKGN